MICRMYFMFFLDIIINRFKPQTIFLIHKCVDSLQRFNLIIKRKKLLSNFFMYFDINSKNHLIKINLYSQKY